jgi:hypothetical protein
MGFYPFLLGTEAVQNLLEKGSENEVRRVE